MKKLITKVFVAFILNLFILIPISCYTQISIDLDKLVLNDSIKLSELKVETITNIFGRPNALTTYGGMEVEHLIHYFDLGLCFWVNPPKKDPEQRITSLVIYLSKNWNEEHSEFYMPYSGSLNPNLNLNMKMNMVPPLFINDTVKVMSAQEIYDKKLEDARIYNKTESGKAFPYFPTRGNRDIMAVKRSKAEVIIICETMTKYLEQITISFIEK